MLSRRLLLSKLAALPLLAPLAKLFARSPEPTCGLDWPYHATSAGDWQIAAMGAVGPVWLDVPTGIFIVLPNGQRIDGPASLVLPFDEVAHLPVASTP